MGETPFRALGRAAFVVVPTGVMAAPTRALGRAADLGDNDIQWAGLFLWFISQLAPGVLSDLAGEPYDCFCGVPLERPECLWWEADQGIVTDQPSDAGAPLAVPTSAFRSWAERWHTPELAGVGLRQIVAWRLQRHADPSRWEWPSVEIILRAKLKVPPLEFTYEPAVGLTPLTDCSAPLEEIATRARRSFEENLQRYLRERGPAIYQELRRMAEIQPKPPLQRRRRKYFAEEHMRWLVRYQILNESMSSIGRSASCHRQTVADALEDCASLVGIKLRPPNFRTRRKAG